MLEGFLRRLPVQRDSKASSRRLRSPSANDAATLEASTGAAEIMCGQLPAVVLWLRRDAIVERLKE